MKLIVGIGNPDPEYAQTRHNVGWLFLDWLLKRSRVKGQELIARFEEEKKILSQVSKVDVSGTKAWLVKPQTYVNKSGEAVKKAIVNCKLKIENLIVIHDDLDIPFGMCKLSFEKNSGGHKGVESIMLALKSKKFYRVRIGTGVRALDKARDQSDKKRDEFVREFVLHKFTPAQSEELTEIFKACLVRLLQALRA